MQFFEGFCSFFAKSPEPCSNICCKATSLALPNLLPCVLFRVFSPKPWFLRGIIAPMPQAIFLLEVLAASRLLLLGLSAPSPDPFSFYSERKGGKETAIQRVFPLNWQQVRKANLWSHPWTPSAQPAGAKGWAVPHTAPIIKRLAVLCYRR